MSRRWEIGEQVGTYEGGHDPSVGGEPGANRGLG